MYIDKTSLFATAQSVPLPVDHEYSWRKAMDWRWVAACVQRAGRGHIVSPRAQLVISKLLYAAPAW